MVKTEDYTGTAHVAYQRATRLAARAMRMCLFEQELDDEVAPKLSALLHDAVEDASGKAHKAT